MKKISLLSCLVFLIHFVGLGQSLAPLNSQSFNALRESDFTKLLGNEEGPAFSYDPTKSVISFKGGGNLGRVFVLQGQGTFGTTTNVSTIGTQNNLITFSLSAIVSYLINVRAFTSYYLDPNYIYYFDRLNSTESIDDINRALIAKLSASNTKLMYTYRPSFQKDVLNHKHTKTESQYTYKRYGYLISSSSYNDDEYAFYNGSAAFVNQQYITDFHTLGEKVSFNEGWFWNKTDFRWRGIRPNFIFNTFYYNYGLSNNIAQLKKVNVNDVSKTVFDSSSNTERQVAKTNVDYDGQYQQFLASTFGDEVLYAPIQYIALDVLGEYNFVRSSDQTQLGIRDYANLQVGVFFYGNAASSSKVNFGIFYQWTRDISTKETGWSHLIGIKTTVPIKL